MARLGKLREVVLGKARDPLSADTRHSIALIAFFAWVGLGADGLSSSCYGPEEAYLALGEHTHLGLYLAAATVITVFIISLAYNQVVELFPTGGGGYRVASQLVGPKAGVDLEPAARDGRQLRQDGVRGRRRHQRDPPSPIRVLKGAPSWKREPVVTPWWSAGRHPTADQERIGQLLKP